MAEKKYLNGIFIKEVAGQYGSFFNASIHVNNFIKQLQELQGAGDYVKVTIAKRQEKDAQGNTHFMKLNEYVAPKKDANDSQEETGYPF